ncbi:MAG: hypothetical protein WBL70_01495 [Candidatus Acidiferrales bacterium]
MYVVEQYRLSVAWRFRQADIPRNNRFKDLGAEEASEVRSDLFRQRRTIIVHGEEDALDGKRRIYAAAEPHEGVEKFGYSLEGEIFALYRHEDGVGSGESVKRQEVERRRTIKQNELVISLQLVDESFQPVFAILHVDELDGGTDKILVGRDEIEAFDLRFEEKPLDGFVEDELMVKGTACWIFGESEGGGHIALGIAVNEEGAALGGGERGTEIYGSCGLTYAAFLIGNGDYAPQNSSPDPWRI